LLFLGFEEGESFWFFALDRDRLGLLVYVSVQLDEHVEGLSVTFDRLSLARLLLVIADVLRRPVLDLVDRHIEKGELVLSFLIAQFHVGIWPRHNQAHVDLFQAYERLAVVHLAQLIHFHLVAFI
jgi:hypothetical protein